MLKPVAVHSAQPPLVPHVDPRRVTHLNQRPIIDGPIIYWMSRDQRVRDNWALLYAQQLAQQQGQSLLVVFTLVPTFLEATARQYEFLLRGLEEVEHTLCQYGIPFVLLLGDPAKKIVTYAKRLKAGAVITDFDPLRIKRAWRDQVAQKLSCACLEVDAHNIVPCRVASPKQEFGAYTLRPKIHRLLSEFLVPFPTLKKHPVSFAAKRVDWGVARRSLKMRKDIPEGDWCKPGETAAHRALRSFLVKRLPAYDTDRNDPGKDGQSHLSPYLHFGQLSAQRVALAVQASGAPRASVTAFLEELIVRRELSDNFCWYQSAYDDVKGFPAWAQKTLAEHAHDRREYVYDLATFEHGHTHDPLWNAAQQQMVQTGKMHGYLRMYWAKKILEWTKRPSDALAIAITLNDRYSLDGRDPNGYVGIAWSIGGVHDRAWFDRPIFGKIRFMSYNGCASKFDVPAFIARYPSVRGSRVTRA